MGTCVEVDTDFRKSSYCTYGNCVEVAVTEEYGVAVRDSKDPAGSLLYFTREEWNAFIAGVKAGEFE
jgi:hypothetical protein